MDHLPYFNLLNESEKAHVFFSFIDKTDKFPLSRDNIKLLYKTSFRRGFYYDEQVEDKYLSRPNHVPENIKFDKFDEYINRFSDRYLTRNFYYISANILKTRKNVLQSSKYKGKLFQKHVKRLPSSGKRHREMTDSLYSRQGRLLDYHWDGVNMHYDFGIVLPYMFMGEGYRTLDIQHYFSPLSALLLKKFSYSTKFFSMQHFTDENNYFLSLELEKENSVDFVFHNKPLLSKLNQLKIIKIIK